MTLCELILRSHGMARALRRVHLQDLNTPPPVIWGANAMYLSTDGFCLKSGCNVMGQEGKEVCLCLCLRYFHVARSDEIFVVHDVNCLTRVDLAVLPRACNWITVDGDWSTRSRCV